MKIAIVDDDAQDTNRLAAFLAEWSEEHHLDFSVTVFHKSSDFLKAFETARYSLVFMDIYMGPPSGIETAMKLREKTATRFLFFLPAVRNICPTPFAATPSTIWSNLSIWSR